MWGCLLHILNNISPVLSADVAKPPSDLSTPMRGNPSVDSDLIGEKGLPTEASEKDYYYIVNAQTGNFARHLKDTDRSEVISTILKRNPGSQVDCFLLACDIPF